MRGLPDGLVAVNLSGLAVRVGGDAPPPFDQLVAFVSEQVGGRATPSGVYLARADWEALHALTLAAAPPTTAPTPPRRKHGPWVAPLLPAGRAVVRPNHFPRPQPQNTTPTSPQS